MKCLWSIFLVVVLLVDWLDCSTPSKDPGTRRRKNKLRTAGSSTTSTQTLELHDLLNVSTTPTTAASARFSSQEKPDASKNEEAGPHPIEITNAESKIKVIPLNNITNVEDNNDRRWASVDSSRGTMTSNSSSQGRPSEIVKTETNGRKTITLSSPLSSTISSSLSSDKIIITTRNDSSITTYTRTTTPTVQLTPTVSSKANVTGNLTGFTQRCLSEQAGGSCVSSTVASSSSSSSAAAAAASTAAGGRGTIADAAAPNSHPASSSQTPSGLTQQPAPSWGGDAAVAVAAVGGPSAQARTAACVPCDVRQCQPVFPESCQGLIRKDVCSCCPICSSYEDAGTGMMMMMMMMVTTSAGVGGVGGNAGSGVNVCDSIRCPRGRVCLLNIQGLPMCRCPSVFQCRRLPDRPVCSTDGRTFKNRCFLGVEECASGRTLSIAHDGRCDAEAMMMVMVTTLASPSSAIRSSHTHQSQFLMSDERVRHQGYRVRNNRQRQHRRQKQTREHERQPHPDGAVAAAAGGDKRRPDAPQAKRKSSQRD